MKAYFGEIHNGTVVLKPGCRLREGQRVRIETVEEPPPAQRSSRKPLPLDEHHPACGMWKNRKEMADSVSYSRAVRNRLSRRGGHE